MLQLKHILSIIVLCFTISSFAQNSIVIEGYIYMEDSVAAPNVYLINYRNNEISITNKNGYFKIDVEQGDSLIVNHISLKPKVVHANDIHAGNNKIYIPYRTYILRAISSDNYEREMESMSKNMQQIRKSTEKQEVVMPYALQGDGNTYNRDKTSPGITIPILKFGGKERKKKRVKE